MNKVPTKVPASGKNDNNKRTISVKMMHRQMKAPHRPAADMTSSKWMTAKSSPPTGKQRINQLTQRTQQT
jgi:hypothetical protein